jgi:hypothetical protein
MPVSDAMRRVEQEIDERLRQLPLWLCPRDAVIKASLDFYRDAHEMILIAIFAVTSGSDEFYNLNLQLQRHQAGFFQVLKWALLWCPERSAETFNHEKIHEAQLLGTSYQTLVDSLKLGNYDLVEIAVDEGSRLVTIYEGGDITSADWSLVVHQRRANIFHWHTSLTEDADQLTKAWTAGEYRRTAAWSSKLASDAQSDTVMFRHSGRAHA